jgi:hypothetical protein
LARLLHHLLDARNHLIELLPGSGQYPPVAALYATGNLGGELPGLPHDAAGDRQQVAIPLL